MGLKYMTTKTKEQTFDISSRNNTKFSGSIRAKLGTPNNPLRLVVHSAEKREELRELCDEKGWIHRIKVKPNQEEDLNDQTDETPEAV